MKYIRTEDGSIENKNKTICYAFRKDYISPNWNDDIEKFLQTKIVAEADTIEELCDEIVFYDLEEECMQILSPSFSKWTILNDLKDGRIKDNNVYGAIWTEQGLKYVAKMNDKGEFEKILR